MDVLLVLKLNQNWFYYFDYTNVVNEDCLKGHPHPNQQNIRLFHRVLYFYRFIYYVLFLDRWLFLFSVQFSLLAVVLGWILAILVLERDILHFHAQNTLVFTLVVLRVITFASTVLALIFHSYVVKSMLVFLVYFVVRFFLVKFFVVRLLDSLREFLPWTCFK